MIIDVKNVEGLEAILDMLAYVVFVLEKWLLRVFCRV